MMQQLKKLRLIMVVCLVLSMCSSLYSQVIDSKQYNYVGNWYRWQGGSFITNLNLPKVQATTGRDTGAVYYRLADSSILVWTGSQWRQMAGGAGSADSSVFATRYYTQQTFVPYTGATGSVNLGLWGLTTDRFVFNQTPTLAGGERIMRWNDTDGTLDVGMKGGNVTLQVGQEQHSRVRNNTGSTITNGQVVYISGSTGTNTTVALAKADASSTSQTTIGIATEDITNGQSGFVTTFGKVRDINTTGLTEGSPVYLSSTVAGGLTSTAPTGDTYPIVVGICERTHAVNGVIFVHVDREFARKYEVDTAKANIRSEIGGGSTVVNDSLAYGFQQADSSVSGADLTPVGLGWTKVNHQRYWAIIDENHIRYSSSFEIKDTTAINTLSGVSPTLTDGKLVIAGSSLIQMDNGPKVPYMSIELDVDELPSTLSGLAFVGPALIKDASTYIAGFVDQRNNAAGIYVNGTQVAFVNFATGELGTGQYKMWLNISGKAVMLWMEWRGKTKLLTKYETTIDLTKEGALDGWKYGIYSSQSGTTVSTVINSLRAGAAGGIGMLNNRMVTFDDGTPYVSGNKTFFTADWAVPGLSITSPAYVFENSTVFSMDMDNYNVEPVGRFYFKRDDYDDTTRIFGGAAVKLRWFPDRKQWLLTYTHADNPSGLWRKNDQYAWLDYEAAFGENLIEQSQLQDLGIDTVANPNLTYDINVRYDRNTSTFHVLGDYTNVPRGGSITGVSPRLYSGPSMDNLTTVVTKDTVYYELGTWAKLRGDWYAIYWGTGQWNGLVLNSSNLNTIGFLDLPYTASSMIPGMDWFPYQKNGKTKYYMIGFDTVNVDITWTRGALVVYEADSISTGYEHPIVTAPQIPYPIRQASKNYLDKNRVGSLYFGSNGVNSAYIMNNARFNGTTFEHKYTGGAAVHLYQEGEANYIIRSSQAAGTAFADLTSQMKIFSDGRVALGGSISSSVGSVSGAAAIINTTGIGSGTSPTQKFHAYSTANGNVSYLVETTSTGSAAQADIRFKNSTSNLNFIGIYSTGASYAAASAGSFFHYTNGTAPIVFMTDNASGLIKWATGGNAEKMRLDAAGALSIGSAANANTSSIVDMTSTTKGFLPPRMTATQASAISSPAEGLLVYVTDTNGTFTSKGWWGYNGAAWEKLNN